MKNLCLYVCAAALVAVATPVYAQGNFGFVDVNVGVATMFRADEELRTIDLPVDSELATFSSIYDFPRGTHFDFGGGYMFTRLVGFGVNFSGDATEGFPTSTIRIPHPTFFNAFATDTAVGETEMQRTEGAVNLSLLLNVASRSKNWVVKVFVGPSYYRVTQDVVNDITYDQQFLVFVPVQTVDIQSYEIKEAKGTGWGVHGGVDVGYFFSRIVGVGVGFKMAVADVTLEDIIGEYESKAGATTLYGGLRLRFGEQ